MNDWKLILKVTIGCAALLLVAIWGLSKMAGPENALKVEESVLLDGARFVKENGETKVTVVNFSDMQCPSCKAADIQTKELFNMPGVKIVTRLFPLPSSLHRYALISAKAAEAARVLGKGFEMVAVLYDKQEEWSAVSKPEDNFADYAKSLGLDEKTFREKLASNEVAQNVQADANLATSLQLSGTPTFFVNGEQVGAPFVVDKVKQLLGEK
ncbi:TPA: hypothetical protein DIU27_01650 [Candidatus Collierbacteria bacterium]|nr:MAG: DSBA oxidoreductase [Candidatus Collierbacteria bacterium GW2011_GWA2_44_13]KKT61177.1 MAG: DSBA oxidoreductase [Candidatus Collierbacteria bacterium GW2011_GWD1_44_27]KKT65328.1 MAG: DSBA oxidoreductase [Candidatus Collierbacteria bacterium GW2011_GWC2_44_30]KKT68267.1 MAG: DsbA oxidoreductase [Microgenomates group bacterium GW2011_GWC1_44_37]HCQ31072.1 hypothetical protein [Candidatus Collierbacteria bacterium]